jgi:hypothetical protein
VTSLNSKDAKFKQVRKTITNCEVLLRNLYSLKLQSKAELCGVIVQIKKAEHFNSILP